MVLDGSQHVSYVAAWVHGQILLSYPWQLAIGEPDTAGWQVHCMAPSLQADNCLAPFFILSC